MDFIHSVLAQNETVTKDTVRTWDLPVQPLSHIIITLRALNAAAFECTKYELESLIRKVEILYKGAAIVSLSGVELDTYNALVFRNLPILGNQVAAIDSVRTLCLVIPFGRKIFDPAECFPATKKGELQLQITWNTDAATPNVGTPQIQIETVELPGASPKQYVRVTTLTKTPTAVGLHDIDLPIGNKFIGIQLHATTVPIGIVWTKSISYIKLLVNNLEFNYAKANWESLHGMLLNKIGHREPYDLDADHDHYMNAALMDFDPLGDDKYLLDSKGMASLKLRIYADVADAILVHPIELVAA